MKFKFDLHLLTKCGLFPCFASFFHSFCNFFAMDLTNILQVKKGSDKTYTYPNPNFFDLMDSSIYVNGFPTENLIIHHLQVEKYH